MYLLNDSDTVLHSLFLRNSMLVYLVFRSIQVMKYLNPVRDSSNGPHMSETAMSPMLSGRFLVLRNGALVCLLCGQLVHWVMWPCWMLRLNPSVVCSFFIDSRVE